MVVTFHPNRDGGHCHFSLTDPQSPEVRPLEVDSLDGVLDDSRDDTASAIVKEVGAKLASALEQNVSVQSALIAASTGKNERQSIYFEIHADDADKRPWEALYFRDRFFALDPQSPIGRMCSARSQQEPPAEQYITLKPFRVLAVLGVPAVAKAEFDTLRDAFSESVLQGYKMPVEIHVLTSNEEVLQEVAQLNNDSWRAANIDNKWTITDFMKQHRPKLIHLSCDRTEGASPDMKLAGRKVNGKHEDIYLTAPDLANFGDGYKLVWLITLSCADDAKEVKSSNRFARWLVQNGFPAVVGMRGLPDSTLVTKFYTRFYRVAMDRLNQIPFGGKGLEVDWADLLVEGRNAMLHEDKGKETCCHWTFPVIYCLPTPVRLSRFDAWDTQKNIQIAAEIRGLSVFHDELAATSFFDKGKLMQPFADRIAKLETEFEKTR